MGSTAGKPEGHTPGEMKPASPTSAAPRSPSPSAQAAGGQAPARSEAASSAKSPPAASGKASSSMKKPASSMTTEPRTVLGKYHMRGTREDIMGKGTSSICHKAVEVETGRPVAVKIYKDQQKSGSGKIKDTTMQKFKRQIDVLKELMEPFKEPEETCLWSDVLRNIGPKQVFMQLIDYSRDENGEPGPDPKDGMLYVVTELAGYSLKDFLADRREKQKMLSREAVRDLTKRVLLAMAGLHAKGLVHIDMKPENLMVFDGRLKVIDVDGCVQIGSRVSINDGSISFSPCYCAPEWARFMIKESEQTITATPSLDVWSIGMLLCELIALDAIWKPQYANFMRNASSHREAGFLFLEWLGDIKKPPLPRSVERFDPNFLELLHSWLLVVDVPTRKTCAESLSNEWLAQGGWAKYGEKQEKVEAPAHVPRIPRDKDETSLDRVLHTGVLFKLNTNGNPQDHTHWIKRDMWLAQNRSLCYYSVKENKRLILVDGETLVSAKITPLKGLAKEWAFEILSKEGTDEQTKIVLACDSAEDLEAWSDKFHLIDQDISTFQLGQQMAEDIRAFKVAVQNRRMKVSGDKEAFEPAFKAKLWKLKAQGDRSKPEDWFLRDMWIAKNGSLVYFSPKEDRELVYYTAADITHCKVLKIEDAAEEVTRPDSDEAADGQAVVATESQVKEVGQACKGNAFQIQLRKEGDVEYEPGTFAAETAESREEWLGELLKHTG